MSFGLRSLCRWIWLSSVNRDGRLPFLIDIGTAGVSSVCEDFSGVMAEVMARSCSYSRFGFPVSTWKANWFSVDCSNSGGSDVYGDLSDVMAKVMAESFSCNNFWFVL